MTRRVWVTSLLGAVALAVLLLVFWSWRQGGLALLQLDMMLC